MISGTPILHDLQFETGTTCNAKCSFCTHSKMKRRGSAKWSTILHTLYWLAPKVKTIAPFLMQEPLLEKRMPAILANAKQFNSHAETILYSNMSVFDEDWWTRIIRFNTLDKLCVSFYGTDKEIYGKLQPPLDYEKTQQNIQNLLKLRAKLRQRKPFVSLHILVTLDTVGKAKALEKQWMGIVDQVGYAKWDSWCGELPYDDKWESCLWGPSEEERLPCMRLWVGHIVHFDGTVVPCCLDYDEAEPCGNILADPFTFTNNPRLNEIRKLHLEGRFDEIKLCKDCMVWRRDITSEWREICQKQKLVACAAAPSIS